MALVQDKLSTYVQALLTQLEWGSPLLASASGTAARVHGTDPAWWIGEMSKYPEMVDWRWIGAGQQYYSANVQNAMEVNVRPEAPPAGRVYDPTCRLSCFVLRPREVSYEECVRHCEEREAGRRRVLLGGPREIARELAPWAIGVALVVLGAWALVR